MVARLKPPVEGSTVERNYSTNVSDHWSNLPTAVKSLNLTAIYFPLLLDSPERTLNSAPLKIKNLPKLTMKTSFLPTLDPRASRLKSASQGEDAPRRFRRHRRLPSPSWRKSYPSRHAQPSIPNSSMEPKLLDPPKDQS